MQESQNESIASLFFTVKTCINLHVRLPNPGLWCPPCSANAKNSAQPRSLSYSLRVWQIPTNREDLLFRLVVNTRQDLRVLNVADKTLPRMALSGNRRWRAFTAPTPTSGWHVPYWYVKSLIVNPHLKKVTIEQFFPHNFQALEIHGIFTTKSSKEKSSVGWLPPIHSLSEARASQVLAKSWSLG